MHYIMHMHTPCSHIHALYTHIHTLFTHMCKNILCTYRLGVLPHALTLVAVRVFKCLEVHLHTPNMHIHTLYIHYMPIHTI